MTTPKLKKTSAAKYAELASAYDKLLNSLRTLPGCTVTASDTEKPGYVLEFKDTKSIEFTYHFFEIAAESFCIAYDKIESL